MISTLIVDTSDVIDVVSSVVCSPNLKQPTLQLKQLIYRMSATTIIFDTIYERDKYIYTQ